MASLRERGGRWLRGELPELIAAGVISEETARALERHYPAENSERSRRSGVLLLAIIGSALVAAGIILLIAHNWDEFSRPLRSAIAFLPLLAAQGLSAFVLWRRDQSQPWRESAAIFNVAAIGAAISLVSQTYQIHGTIANFLLVWMLLSLPLVYLLRTTLGACAYLLGADLWLFHHDTWRFHGSPLFFWLLLLGVLPYFALLCRKNRNGREATALAVVLAIVSAVGLGYTASYTHTGTGVLAFAGFFAAIYICGIEFFRLPEGDLLHPIATISAVAIGVMSIVLSFQEIWIGVNNAHAPTDFMHTLGLAIQLFFPAIAVLLAVWSFARGKIHFSLLAAGFPIVTALGWMIAHYCLPERMTWERSDCDLVASLLFNLYTLALGIELIARGLRADSLMRSNFGLLIIAGLAAARFFDSDLTFVVRACGFIVIGLGFLAANLIFFRKQAAR